MEQTLLINTKVCTLCNIEKPLDCFDKNDGYYRNQCKRCRLDKYNERYLKKHPPKEINKNPTSKVCSTCGIKKDISEFEKRDQGSDGYRNQCKKCKRNKDKQRYKHICKWCGEEFTSSNKDQDHCSNKCKSQKKCNKVKVKCHECGKEFLRSKFDYEKYNLHFCSMDCLGEHRKGLYKGDKNPKWKSIECCCSICGKKIYLSDCHLKNKKHHYCSIACKNKGHSLLSRGENNPNWNPNKTDEERKKERNIEGYSDWRNSVFERDNYTCQCCGDNKGGNLNSHHLNGYNWDKDHRTDVNNGVTLCNTCHKQFHDIYGYGYNTKQQYELFSYGMKVIQEII